MDVRRTFAPELAAAFGEERMRDLRKRIDDLGKPILLASPASDRQLVVSEGGTLFLGSGTSDMPRPTWRDFLQQVGGLEGRAPTPIARLIKSFGPVALDEPVDDARWGVVYRIAYDPMAAAYHLLRCLETGPETDRARPENGRIDLLVGFAYSGEDDVWVEAQDDFSVSLLQARLIQLRQPIRIVMEAGRVVRAEDAMIGSQIDPLPSLRLAF